MDLHGHIVFLHILLFVFWLGADVGVFILGKMAQSPAHTVEQRLLLLQGAMIIDIFPRVSFALVVPSGLHLAASLGALALPAGALAAAWAFGLTWAAIVLAGRMQAESKAAPLLHGLDQGVQAIVLVGFLGLGGLSLATGAPIADGWLAAKALILGVIAAFSMLLERAFKPATAAFMALAAEGSSPDLEKSLRGAMDTTYIWVLSIYGGVLIAAYLGVLQPF